jgi:hypothetical protein
MIRDVKQKMFLAGSLLSMCWLLGCATTTFNQGHRFYSGTPLPNNEIALVFLVTGCSIYDIRNETEKEEKILGARGFLGPWDVLDLLPGRYTAGIIYTRISDRTATAGRRLQVELNFQAGNIYVIYPELTRAKEEQTWHPIFVNINDYSKEECQKHSGLLECYEKDKISELASKYLQSERRIMSFIRLKSHMSGNLEVYDVLLMAFGGD